MPLLFILWFWLGVQGEYCKNGPCSELCCCPFQKCWTDRHIDHIRLSSLKCLNRNYCLPYPLIVPSHCYIAYIQCLRIEFRPLDFFHILLHCSLLLKWIKYKIILSNLHTIPHNCHILICFFVLVLVSTPSRCRPSSSFPQCIYTRVLCLLPVSFVLSGLTSVFSHLPAFSSSFS